MFTNFVTFTHAEGQILLPNETISSHRLEEPAVHVKCCLLCDNEPKCVGFNYRTTAMNDENCQLTNVTRNSNTSKTGDWALYLDMEAVSKEYYGFLSNVNFTFSPDNAHVSET